MPRSLRTALLALVPVLVLLLAHARTLPAAWRGEIYYGYRLDSCDSYLTAERAPPTDSIEKADGCDVLYSHRMAFDAWLRVKEAWEGRTSVPMFLVSDLWRTGVDARALNILDFLLVLWPARLFLEPAHAFTVVQLGLVAVTAVAGVLFARGLGASELASVAAGVVAGTSGMLTESVLRGQYPQAASMAAFFAFFLGLHRILAGERGGVALGAAGLAASMLFYWQNAIILGVGAGLWALGAALGRVPVAPGAAVRIAKMLVLAALPCIPGAAPVIRTMLAGTEEKLALVPWGTAYPVGSFDPRVYADLIDEVPWFVALAPNRGWILPALPLIPVVAVGLWSRRALPWALLAVFGALMILGPLPAIGLDYGGVRVDGFTSFGRAVNRIYTFVYQWVPTASRMKHPLRYGALLSVALTAAAALGLDRFRARFPDHALLAAAAGIAWAAVVGPWPLRSSPFPGAFLTAVRNCTELDVPGSPSGETAMDDMHRLDGLSWIPRYPLDEKRAGGVGLPSPALIARSGERSATLAAMLRGAPSQLPAGACVLYEATWCATEAGTPVSPDGALGTPDDALSPHLFVNPKGGPRRVEVYRPK